MHQDAIDILAQIYQGILLGEAWPDLRSDRGCRRDAVQSIPCEDIQNSRREKS